MFISKQQIALKDKYAQTLLEYVILVSIVTIVLTSMTPMLKRGIQSIVKATADQLGVQNQSDQVVNALKVDETGYLVNAFTGRRVRLDTTFREPFGDTTHLYDDEIEEISESTVNLGFTEESD